MRRAAAVNSASTLATRALPLSFLSKLVAEGTASSSKGRPRKRGQGDKHKMAQAQLRLSDNLPQTSPRIDLQPPGGSATRASPASPGPSPPGSISSAPPPPPGPPQARRAAGPAPATRNQPRKAKPKRKTVSKKHNENWRPLCQTRKA